MAYDTVITVDQLRALERCVVLDCGFQLDDTAAGERAHAQGHIPGARYVHLDRDLSAPKTGRNGRHPLPRREDFAATAGALGIAPGVQVVVYDRQGMVYAARAWWMLRWLGHREVAVLDGGIKAWVAAGGELSTAAPAISQQPPYPASAAQMPLITVDELARSLDRHTLIDARSAARFRGENETLDPVAGHIPESLNRCFQDNLAPDGRFLPAAQLREGFAGLVGDGGATAVVHTCGSGVTACQNLLAMMHAGWPATTLYAGSWSEWIADPARPRAAG
jgi:thiosulfate/3-mercaptopyruvate sulfurtransferase